MNNGEGIKNIIYQDLGMAVHVELIFQLKDEEAWDGQFVDVTTESIPNKSVVRVVAETSCTP